MIQAWLTPVLVMGLPWRRLDPELVVLTIGALAAVGFVAIAIWAALLLRTEQRDGTTSPGDAWAYRASVRICSLCALGVLAKAAPLLVKVLAS